MFPIAFASGTIAGRTLKADDIAGISDLYPDGGFTASTGSISGTVTKDGQPIFGAHIVAFDPATGSMVADVFVERTRSVFDQRPVARAARRPRGTARRRGDRQLLRRVAGGRHRLQGGVSRSPRGGCRRRRSRRRHREREPQVTGSRLAMAAVLTALHVTAARAQPVGAVPGRLEFDAGIIWAGAQPLGSQDANLTTGTGSTLRLFSSTSDLLAAAGFEGRVAVKVTRTVDARVSMSYAKPQLTTRVSNDLENSAGATAVRNRAAVSRRWRELIGTSRSRRIRRARSAVRRRRRRVSPAAARGSNAGRHGTVVRCRRRRQAAPGVAHASTSADESRRRAPRRASRRAHERHHIRRPPDRRSGGRRIAVRAVLDHRIQRRIIRRHDVVVCVADRFPVVDR